MQIALGDLSDHLSFRHALRGVETVVHLASVIRDQPNGSIEELAGVATWRLVRAAERAGVERFVFFSALGASTRSRARLMRAKAVPERAVMESSLTHTVIAPSVVYSPRDPFLKLLESMSLLPVMPISGSGRTPFQPIWAGDVDDCVLSTLPGGELAAASGGARYDLAGPETWVRQLRTGRPRRRPGADRPTAGPARVRSPAAAGSPRLRGVRSAGSPSAVHPARGRAAARSPAARSR